MNEALRALPLLMCACTLTHGNTQSLSSSPTDVAVMSTSHLISLCAPGTENTECTFLLRGEHACEHCLQPKVVELPMFVGIKNAAPGAKSTWRGFCDALTTHLSTLGTAVTKDEGDEIWFTHDHSASKVLGPPYFESVTVHVRAFEDTGQSLQQGTPSLRVRFSLFVSVTLNPKSAYREPDATELGRYQEAVRKAVREATAQSCLAMHGKLRGGVCDLRP